ncbi:MAG: EFR1 family ferrodoxin [Lachnospiraceae bacterium]|jgi:NAD-dependent dihydropyrimidine dehydrogenase PreA subunit/flavodoxin|nr:EFR1 family ferrodoxin [Lachnospiraceae bacterium]
MILYFTGTGNSEYVAKRIANGISDDITNLFDKIRSQDYSGIHSDRPWVITAPAYAWRIPHILERWLEKTELTGNKNIYFIMTCGGSIGNAGRYLKALCGKKGMNYLGCYGIVMPENYIAMFSTPAREEAFRTIEKAEGEIDRAIGLIKNSKAFSEPQITLGDKMNSGIVNSIFYPLFVHAKKFYATDACIACGKCEKVCPTKNIRIENGKPVWGKDCTHCMACICRCPKEAIEYGKHSKGLPRYTCPK